MCSTQHARRAIHYLRSVLDELRDQRAQDDWVKTVAYMDREPTRRVQELQEAEEDWSRLKTHGLAGLLGAVLALAGGVVTALAGA